MLGATCLAATRWDLTFRILALCSKGRASVAYCVSSCKHCSMRGTSKSGGNRTFKSAAYRVEIDAVTVRQDSAYSAKLFACLCWKRCSKFENATWEVGHCGGFLLRSL